MMSRKPYLTSFTTEEIQRVYLFYKKWNGKYYYPGFCFVLKEDKPPILYSEKPDWFVFEDEDGVAVPPETLDIDVKRESWPVPPAFHIYAKHVIESKHHHKHDYHTWANSIKEALEYMHDLPGGRCNQLIRLGEQLFNECQLNDKLRAYHIDIIQQFSEVIQAMKPPRHLSSRNQHQSEVQRHQKRSPSSSNRGNEERSSRRSHNAEEERHEEREEIDEAEERQEQQEEGYVPEERQPLPDLDHPVVV